MIEIVEQLIEEQIRLQIAYMEREEGIRLTQAQKDIIRYLYDNRHKFVINAVPRRSGKTFLCRLLLKYFPEVTLVVPTYQMWAQYPREVRDRVIIAEMHNFSGQRFETVVYDEFTPNEDYSFIPCNKFLGLTSMIPPQGEVPDGFPVPWGEWISHETEDGWDL